MNSSRLTALAFGVSVLAACGSGEGPESDLATSKSEIIRATQTGGRNEVVMVYAFLSNGSGARTPMPSAIRWRNAKNWRTRTTTSTRS